MNRLKICWPWLLAAMPVMMVFLLRLRESRQVLLDYDDGVYWQTALAVGDGHDPYADVFHAQPPLFVWLLSLPFRFLSDAPAETTGRLMMVAFAMVLVAAAGGIAHVLAGRHAGLVAMLLTALLPVVQRYSFQFGADLPAAALISVAMWCALRARVSGSRWLWLASGALLGAAAMVKLAALVVVPALAMLIAATGGRRRLNSTMWTITGLAACTAVLLVLLRPPLLAWRQIVMFHLDATSPPSSGAPSPLDAVAIWMVAFALLASLAMVVAIVLSPKPQRPYVLAVGVWAAAFGPFVALYRPVFEHHLLIFVVPGTVSVAVALFMVWDRVPSLSTSTIDWRTAGIVALAVVCLAHAAFVPVSRPYAVASIEACLAQLPRGQVLLTDDQELAARSGLRTPPWLADTSRVRIQSGYLTDDEIIAAVNVAGAVVLAPPQRSRIDHPAVLTYVEDNLPGRFEADGYRLFVPDMTLIAGCSR